MPELGYRDRLEEREEGFRVDSGRSPRYEPVPADCHEHGLDIVRPEAHASGEPGMGLRSGEQAECCAWRQPPLEIP